MILASHGYTGMYTGACRQLDLSRIGVLGHSLGADTAMTGLRLQREIKARFYSILSRFRKAPPPEATSPSCSSLREENSGRMRSVNSRAILRGAQHAVLFLGADHFAATDAVWLGAYLPELHAATGNIGPDKTVDAIRNYVAKFFASYLSGEPPGGVAQRLIYDHGDVAVVTRSRRPLCSTLPIPAGASN